MDSSQNLVSVIIPCYEQGSFLAEAIGSVLVQTYREYEIVVVDDGSKDNTAEVAAGFPQVRYVRQPNRGTAGARNLGIRESKGGFLVFLDADDRLLPDALETGMKALTAKPQCAMTFGSCRHIDGAGNRLPTPRRTLVRDDYYLAFLRRCYIDHPASVMFRRHVFDAGVAFDESLAVCSDFESYLQVARRWPIYCHNETVSEYRRHGLQKSANVRRMIDHVVRILKAQKPFTRGHRSYERTRRKGIRLARHWYSNELIGRAWKNFCAGNLKDARRDFAAFLRYEPPLAGWILSQAAFKTCFRRFEANTGSRRPV